MKTPPPINRPIEQVETDSIHVLVSAGWFFKGVTQKDKLHFDLVSPAGRRYSYDSGKLIELAALTANWKGL